MRGSIVAKFLFLAVLLGISQVLSAQTTVTSGNWLDPTVWSGGAVPAAGGTVNVNNPLTINTNLSPTGVWTFNSNTTDPPGGTAYTFNPNAGTNAITISASATVTFEGGTAGTPNIFSSGTIDIYGTLILGYTQLNNSANSNINIKAGGTLIIYGDLTNKNNSGTLVVAGSLIIYGSYLGTTGSTTLSGSGTIYATGVITTNGGSTVFGYPNDCTRGPCSGTSLACTFDNYISPSAATLCTGVSTVTFTSNPVTSNPPASPTYQWQSSTDNVTFTNVGTNSASYTTPTLSQTTYVRVSISTSTPCTSTSSVSKITVLSTGGWLGTSLDWGTASNWCSNTVPTSTTDVVITNGTGINNMPLIASGTAAVCRDLTISNSFPASSVTLAASTTASLSMFGDFTNNGTFTDNSTAAAAGVKFVGSITQTVAGTTANFFNNLTFANTSGTTPAVNLTSNNITVNSTLTMSTGIINMNGFTITLGTAAGSTGTLAYTSGTRFYGGNIERWIPTSSITVPAVAGQFPIGTSTDYRPIYFGNAGLTAGGTIKVRHTSSGGATAVGTPFVDNVGTVAIRSNSFWTVTTANSIGTGTHAMRTEGTGFGTVANVNDLRQTLVNTISPGSDGTHAGTTTNPQVNRTGLTTANLSNNFYWGSIDATNSPLPIELISFNASLVVGQVQLSWATAAELNNDFFTIERSADAEKFEEVIRIKGRGTFNSKTNYSTVDESPLSGLSYYRLKQTDFDGKFTYSEVRLIENTYVGALLKLYPNPINNNKFMLELNGLTGSSEVPVAIITMQGTIVLQANYRANEFGSLKASIELPLLPSGVYIVVVNAPAGLRRKIVIP